jgi:hypothetical protein
MTSPRTRTAARLVVVPAAIVLGAASLGCGIIQNVMDTANALSEFSDRLGKAAELTYTAEYAVADSDNVMLVQEPPNAALIAGKERAIFLPDSLIICESTRECQRTPMPAGQGIHAADAGLIAGVAGPAFVTPELALGLVAAAALLPGTDVDTSEREFAGEDSLCADVTGVDEAQRGVNADEAADGAAAEPALRSFSICVTEAGLLASFSGTTADGQEAAIELVRYEPTADAAAFKPPKGAEVVDVGGRAELTND